MPPRPLQRALYVLLALGSFVLGTLALGPLVPLAEGGGLDLKLETLRAHRDEFDTLYIGSSRTHRALDPARIDRQLAEAGIPQRSFNLGAPDARPFEQDWLLHEVLRLEPRRLRWILLEGGPIGTASPADRELAHPSGAGTARWVQWHTPRETWRVLATLRRLPLAPRDELRLALAHLGALARNLTHLGQGPALAARLLAGPEARQRRERLRTELERSQGHQDLDAARGRARLPEMESQLQDPREFEQRVERVVRENETAVAPARLDGEFHARQQADAERAGVELVYLTVPTSEGNPELLRLHEQGRVRRLLHFNDPREHPELFDVRERYDPGHLNRLGARRFSQAVAEALLQLWRADG